MAYLFRIPLFSDSDSIVVRAKVYASFDQSSTLFLVADDLIGNFVFTDMDLFFFYSPILYNPCHSIL